MITYDRPELLEEAIYCFLQQTYPHKELIILNDRAEQTIIFDHPLVKVHNLKTRFTNTGEKRRHCASLATGDYLQFWDDDDIHLPWHMDDCLHRLQFFTKKISRAQNYWLNLADNKYFLKTCKWVHTLTIHKNIYWSVDGHESATRNEDIRFIRKLLRNRLLSHYDLPIMRPSFIYNVVTGRVQITSCIKSEEDRCAERWAKVKEEAYLRNVQGDIILTPHWNHDYVARANAAWDAIQ